MSYKTELLDNKKLSYIPNWDFSAKLDLADNSMLCYLIDNDDFKGSNGGWFELTPSYVQKKRPAWRTSAIRSSLTSLTELGYILKRDYSSGRGNFYRLNIEKINRDLIEPFLEDKLEKEAYSK